MADTEYKIVPKNGEFEVYVNNELKYSAKTMIEAIDELEKILFAAKNGG